MSKDYRATRMGRAQLFLLPPSLDEFVSVDAPVRIFSEVVDALDLSVLTLGRNISRSSGRGAPGYDPRLLFKALAFAYMDGMRSSRRIETAVRYDMRYMWLTEMTPLDHVTLCRFRKENVDAFRALFCETVKLCSSLGLVSLREIAVDGTKLEADVSGRETYGRERLAEEEARLESLLETAVNRVIREAEEADGSDGTDPRSGGGSAPDEMGSGESASGELLVAEAPAQLRDVRRRKERIEKARQEMERSGRSAVAATDPESRVMRVDGRKRPAYNAQAAVDGAHQIIIAADVTQDENDTAQLPPMLLQVQENTGVMLSTNGTLALADAGYWSQPTLEWVESEGVDAYIRDIPAPGRNRPDAHALFRYDEKADRFVGFAAEEGRVLPFWRERVREGRHYRVYRDRRRIKGASGASRERGKELWVRMGDERTSRMREKLATVEGKAIYRRRQEIVEPVFGHIKVAYQLRRLLLRGLQGARSEFLIACIVHNLAKARNVSRACPAIA